MKKLESIIFHNSFIKGDASLWVAFWLLFVGGHLVLILVETSIIVGLLYITNTPHNGNIGLLVLWSSFFLYSIYCVYVLWRCRLNSKWPMWGYLGAGVGIINSGWLAVMFWMYLSIAFGFSQPSTMELLSRTQPSDIAIKPSVDSRAEDITAMIGWIGLWNSEMLDWAENKNTGSKVWTFNIHQKPNAETKIVGSILVTVISQSAFEFAYRAERSSQAEPFAPDLYDQDWGYGPYMHQTFIARNKMWFKLPRNPLLSEGWINGIAISKGGRVNVLPIEAKQIYKLDGKNIFVDKVDLEAIYYRSEQKADMWCFDNNPPPLKKVRFKKASMQSLLNRDGHLKLTIAYTRGC